MKHSLFTFTILSIIAMSLATNLLKVTKKVKTSTKGVSNSWDGGYETSIKIAKGSNGSWTEQAKGNFYATRVQKPTTTAENLGWVFNLDASPGADLKTVMTNVSGNKWYIPYRFISEKCTYHNPDGSNKYNIFWVSNDSHINFQIKVLLPYKLISYYISDEEGTKICTLLNGNATTHRNQLVEAKTATVSASNTYITSKPTYDASTAKGTSLATQVEKLKTTNTDIKAKIESNNKVLATKQTEYNTLKNTASDSHNNLSSMQSHIDQLESEKNSLADTLKALGSDTKASVTQVAELKKTVDNASDAWNSSLTTLKAATPERVAELNLANTGFKTLKMEDINNNFGKIVPS